MVKPVKNLLMVKVFDLENKTASGLIIREAWESPKNKGEVLEVGPEVSLVKKGDKIIFNPYALQEITVDQAGLKKEMQFLLSEKDILATYE